ncbi:MAG: ATP-binding cassette domain-containing protein [Hyphomonadaceae bacterium]|nr:ATP-binding cassette domain-containing protein [Hyphomonadaceae bacterium]
MTVAATETDVAEAAMRDPDMRALKTGLSAFLVVTAFFSISVNILLLVSPLYMLQVYDRVLTSGSMETLILISVLAGGLMVTYVFAESARRHALALAARFLHRRFGEKLFNVNFAESRADGSLQKDLSDLTVVQSFFSNGLILPVFDLPFTPCFLLVLYLIHPLLGWLGVAGAGLLLLITILAELAAREPEKTAQSVERASQDFASGLAGQQSAIVSMGMARQAFQGWSSRKALSDQLSLGTAKSSNFFGALTRGLRQTLQMGALGLGGWLVLQHVATPGVIIAGSIVMGRALAPIDQCVGMWRQIIRARKSWKNVRQRAANPLAKQDEYTPMPRPDPRLELINLEVGHPGAEQRVLPRFSLTLERGTVLAIVGPSGIGKSTLLQTLTGVWSPLDGQVTLGGRDLHEWNQNDRGQYVGYLPQDVELLPGTVVQNIARFTQADSAQVIATAKDCGAHEMVSALADGYDTVIGPGGAQISAGQKQAIGLARALFGAPPLLALDEPSANLDEFTIAKLTRTLAAQRAAGHVVLIATHDVRMIQAADRVLLLNKNEIKLVGADAYRAAIANKLQPATREALS